MISDAIKRANKSNLWTHVLVNDILEIDYESGFNSIDFINRSTGSIKVQFKGDETYMNTPSSFITLDVNQPYTLEINPQSYGKIILDAQTLGAGVIHIAAKR